MMFSVFNAKLLYNSVGNICLHFVNLTTLMFERHVNKNYVVVNLFIQSETQKKKGAEI